MGLCAHIARMYACITHMMRRTDRPRAHVVSVLSCFYVHVQLEPIVGIQVMHYIHTSGHVQER